MTDTAIKKPESFTAPLFDLSGIGFKTINHNGANWRQRTVAGISYNHAADIAIAFNADGLALPMEHNRYTLPELLQTATRREFGAIHGAGRYGKESKPLADRIAGTDTQDWVTHWLPAPAAGYANDRRLYDQLAANAVADALNLEGVLGDSALSFNNAVHWKEYAIRKELEAGGTDHDKAYLIALEKAFSENDKGLTAAFEAQQKADRTKITCNVLGLWMANYQTQIEYEQAINLWLQTDASTADI